MNELNSTDITTEHMRLISGREHLCLLHRPSGKTDDAFQELDCLRNALPPQDESEPVRTSRTCIVTRRWRIAGFILLMSVLTVLVPASFFNLGTRLYIGLAGDMTVQLGNGVRLAAGFLPACGGGLLMVFAWSDGLWWLLGRHEK